MRDPSQKDDPRSGFGWNVNQYLNQYIGFADSKISALVAADLAIIVLLLPNKPSTSLPLIFFILYWVALGLFLTSVIAGFVSFYPRVPRVKKNTNGGLIFWMSILSYPNYTRYQAALKDELQTVEAVEDEYARENYHLSEVLRRKDLAIQVSIFCFLGGLFLAALSTGLSFILK